jgi:hypothetical protein
MNPLRITKVKLVPDSIIKKMDAKEFIDFAEKKPFLIRSSRFVPPQLVPVVWDGLSLNSKMTQAAHQSEEQKPAVGKSSQIPSPNEISPQTIESIVEVQKLRVQNEAANFALKEKELVANQNPKYKSESSSGKIVEDVEAV